MYGKIAEALVKIRRWSLLLLYGSHFFLNGALSTHAPKPPWTTFSTSAVGTNLPGFGGLGLCFSQPATRNATASTSAPLRHARLTTPFINPYSLVSDAHGAGASSSDQLHAIAG